MEFVDDNAIPVDQVNGLVSLLGLPALSRPMRSWNDANDAVERPLSIITSASEGGVSRLTYGQLMESTWLSRSSRHALRTAGL